MFGPQLRKFTLTAHVVSSVGWLGAVGAFLALAIVGLRSSDPQKVRGAYLAMDPLGWYVIVPLSFAALVTGLVQALGTPWGVLRHYWVLFKLLITVVSTIILLVHMRPIAHVSSAAAESVFAAGELRPVRVQLLVDAAAALVALMIATVLSIYKPRGTTRYGRPRQP